MKWFLDLAGFSRPQIDDLLGLAARLHRSPEPDALRGKVLALLFRDQCPHARASMEAAMARLGGQTTVLAPPGPYFEVGHETTMNGETREHLLDAVSAFSRYSHAIGVRSLGYGTRLAADLREELFTQVSSKASVPLINLGSATNNPCQALADWRTLDTLETPGRGGRFTLAWTWSPQAMPYSNPAAILHMATMRGMRVTVLRPDAYALPRPIIEKARQAGQASGGAVLETSDRAEAMDGAHVIYASTWSAPNAYGDEAANASLSEACTSWCVDERWFAGAQENCWLMTACAPRRNADVVDDVIDGPRNVRPSQARSLVDVQMAVLYRMLVSNV